jgi:hypothetical protein
METTETTDRFVRRTVIDPQVAKEKLLNAALEYAEGIKAKQVDREQPTIERRL